MDANLFLTAKAVHIIFVVAWFAGLFYIPRLFIYIVEANQMEDNDRKVIQRQLKIMTKRLWYIITWPAFVIMFISAITLLIVNPAYLQMPWMHVKLTLVGVLIFYHFSLQRMFNRILKGTLKMTATKLRFYNELATILLFAIVFTVVFKTTMSWLYGSLGILILGVTLSIAIVAYKRLRKK
jgi:putative membrane protein